MKRFFIFFAMLAAVWPIHAQTQSWVRSGAGGVRLTAYDSDASGSARITTQGAHPFQVDEVIHITGFVGKDASNTHHHVSNLNGVFKVKAVPDPTHFTIKQLDNSDITPNDTFIPGDGTSSMGATWASKVTQATLPEGPKGLFDGTNGTQMRKLATSTDNGLTSLRVAGNLATVTLSYTHDVQVGNKISIWNTTNSALNGEHSVTSVTPTTFQFSTSRVGNGDYTHNDACGPSGGNPSTIGGTQNCVVVSLWAYTANPHWAYCVSKSDFTNAAGYKHKWDGGSINGFGVYFQPSQGCNAYRFLVDRKRQIAVDAGVYFLTHAERLQGVNWMHNTGTDGGSTSFEHYEYSDYTAAIAYAVFRNYLTAAQRSRYLDLMLNDWGDPANQCSEAGNTPHEMVITSGSAQAGGDGTHIKLAASDNAPDNFYVGNLIAQTNGRDKWYLGRVTAYSSATKTATVTAVSSIPCYGSCSDYDSASFSNSQAAAATWEAPGAGTPYKVIATATVNSNGSTITGINTNFSTALETGDAVVVGRIWTGAAFPNIEFYVTAINSDTGLTTIDGGDPTNYYSGTFQFSHADVDAGQPMPVYVVKQWKQAGGTCGYKWRFSYLENYPSSQPIVYPPKGGRYSNGVYDEGGPYQAAFMALWASMADDDPRANRYFTVTECWYVDFALSAAMQSVVPINGPHYGFLNDWPGVNLGMFVLNNLLPSQYSPIVNGPMAKHLLTWPIYLQNPDHPQNYPFQMFYAGNNSGDAFAVGYPNGKTEKIGVTVGTALNVGKEAGYFRKYTMDRGFYSIGAEKWPDEQFLFADPRIPPLDYTQQPFQRLFAPEPSVISQCNTLTGNSAVWNRGCDFWRHDVMISKSGWNETATQLWFSANSCCMVAYEGPASGTVQLYKQGFLLTSNTGYPGSPNGSPGEIYRVDSGEQADVYQFNGKNRLNTEVGSPDDDTNITHSKISRWASGNHGSWDTAYGDGNSRYSYSMADLTNSWTPAPTRAQRHLAHFKKSGSTEVIVQYDDVQAASSQAGGIRFRINYSQNGENNDNFLNGQFNNPYHEGTTTCLNTANCANGSSDVAIQPGDTIVEHEDGAASDSIGSARVYGLLTKVFSPAAVALKWDGNTAWNGGHTNSVRVCAGSSCGSAATALEAVVVHKITSNTDTTLNAMPLNPDSHWTGVQAEGKVAMFARGGQLQSAANFTTNHTGTAQYLLAGLTPGTYTVTVNGAPVVSGVTVSSGDNSLYFESTAGAVSVGLTQPAVCSITTSDVGTATVRAAYSQQLYATECAAPLSWTVAAGTLCSGLRLDVTGMLAGSPTQSQTCSFTLQVTDTFGSSATRDYTLRVAARQGISLSKQVSCTGCVW